MSYIAHPHPDPPPGPTQNAPAFCVGTRPLRALRALQGRGYFRRVVLRRFAIWQSSEGLPRCGFRPAGKGDFLRSLRGFVCCPHPDPPPRGRGISAVCLASVCHMAILRKSPPLRASPYRGGGFFAVATRGCLLPPPRPSPTGEGGYFGGLPRFGLPYGNPLKVSPVAGFAMQGRGIFCGRYAGLFAAPTPTLPHGGGGSLLGDRRAKPATGLV